MIEHAHLILHDGYGGWPRLVPWVMVFNHVQLERSKGGERHWWPLCSLHGRENNVATWYWKGIFSQHLLRSQLRINAFCLYAERLCYHSCFLNDPCKREIKGNRDPNTISKQVVVKILLMLFVARGPVWQLHPQKLGRCFSSAFNAPR